MLSSQSAHRLLNQTAV
ncbi:Protein of unknown function [Pyronema omphalodes CBS 100304]|uniref:Uncharacterized protein n=1 Tax=Pyronema omphalodes (strain CBS 100304) TaxID=1076935 RepID=U4LGG4_PYROM|nr:Protein of unknown function [Pyronema omphalodes CBS 100304]